MPDLTVSTDPRPPSPDTPNRKRRTVGGDHSRTRQRQEKNTALRVEVGDAYIRDLPERDA